jgi:hypothetical protein
MVTHLLTTDIADLDQTKLDTTNQVSLQVDNEASYNRSIVEIRVISLERQTAFSKQISMI